MRGVFKTLAAALLLGGSAMACGLAFPRHA
ncbi:hypothetical protein BSF44_14830 [Pseudomonas sp. ACN8]|uniref:Lipoprotein n=1 Tax=Pseudomonas fluorescens TaxID=294 RepID=A0A5E7RVY8_PSEFL|nr:hypothetical protein BSF44_14830 [Pseudomonas sp. ACN8]VVP77688.1 hypothetical protein PS938_00370 [Pseudomonas fluorescens]